MGKIKVTENCGGIKGLKIIEPSVFGDARGYFMETYNYNDFAEAGIDCQFVQDNQSAAKKYSCHISKEKLQGKRNHRYRHLNKCTNYNQYRKHGNICHLYYAKFFHVTFALSL